MSEAESSILAAATQGATLLGVILVVVQIWQARREMVADHTQRKNEATMTAVNAARAEVHLLSGQIRDEIGQFGGNQISEEALSKILENPYLLDKVLLQLGILERLSVGVKYKIYDLDILDDVSGTMFISVFDRMYPFISRWRQYRPYAFRNIENLSDSIRRRRQMDEAQRLETFRKNDSWQAIIRNIKKDEIRK